MNESKKWALGEDLSTYDSILDGLTFDDLILTVHCNVNKSEITPAAVRRELLNILESRFEDMGFLVDKNMDKIIEYSRDYYRD